MTAEKKSLRQIVEDDCANLAKTIARGELELEQYKEETTTRIRNSEKSLENARAELAARQQILKESE